MFPKGESKMRKDIIFSQDFAIFAVIAATLAVMVFLIVSQFKVLYALPEQIEEEQELLQQAEKELETLYALQEEEDFLREQLTTYEKKIPQAPQESLLLNYLQDLGDEHMEEFSLVSYDAPEVQEDHEYGEIPLQLNFEGKYKEMLPLMEELVEEDRILRIDDLHISYAGAEDEDILSVSVSAAAFYKEQ